MSKFLCASDSAATDRVKNAGEVVSAHIKAVRSSADISKALSPTSELVDGDRYDAKVVRDVSTVFAQLASYAEQCASHVRAGDDTCFDEATIKTIAEHQSVIRKELDAFCCSHKDFNQKRLETLIQEREELATIKYKGTDYCAFIATPVAAGQTWKEMFALLEATVFKNAIRNSSATSTT